MKGMITGYVEGMRVLNFIPEEKIGGMSLRVLRIAKALPREVISIIATPEVSDELREKVEAAELPLVRLPIHRVRKTKSVKFWLKWIAGFPADIHAARILLRKLQIDVLHMNGLLNLQAVMAAKISGVPVLWHVNDTLPYIPRGVRRVLGKAVARIAAQVVCSSEDAAAYVFGSKWKRIDRLTVLGVPVECMRFRCPDRSTSAGLRARFGFGTLGQVVLGTVSNVNPIKNISLQIKIVKGLVEKGIDAQLVVVGPVFSSQSKHFDELMHMVRKLGVEKRVFFVGYQEDVEDLLRSFDIFLFTSLSESGPMVILEAMLAGLPIVTSRVGIIRSIPSSLGVVSVELSSQHDLTETFIEKVFEILAKDEKPPVEPRQEFIEKTFDVKVIAKKLETLYRAIGNREVCEIR